MITTIRWRSQGTLDAGARGGKIERRRGRRGRGTETVPVGRLASAAEFRPDDDGAVAGVARRRRHSVDHQGATRRSIAGVTGVKAAVGESASAVAGREHKLQSKFKLIPLKSLKICLNLIKLHNCNKRLSHSKRNNSFKYKLTILIHFSFTARFAEIIKNL